MEFKTRDLVSISVSCDPITFIVSLNDDDDNNSGAPDYTKKLPLKDKSGAIVQEDNLRQFDFNMPGAASVEISQVVDRNTQKPVVGSGKRVRAYKEDKQTPFSFGLHPVPVTMYLEGVNQPSPKLDDIGFEFEYFKDQQGKHSLCGHTAVGTVVKVAADLIVQSSKGADFKKNNKMLITSQGKATVTVTPAGSMKPEWFTDDPLGTFDDAKAFTTRYEAGPGENQGRVRVKLTAASTNPAGQVIDAWIPVTASAPSHLQLKSGAQSSVTTVVSSDAGTGSLDLISIVFPYQILDQDRELLQQSTAYGERVPVVRENIKAVLTSPLPAIQSWIATGLKHTADWIDKPGGEIDDRIEITGLNKDYLVVPKTTPWRFSALVDHVGGVVMEIPAGSSHIWFLGVKDPKAPGIVWGVKPGTNNTFSSTVTAIQTAGRGASRRVREIEITSSYNVHVV